MPHKLRAPFVILILFASVQAATAQSQSTQWNRLVVEANKEKSENGNNLRAERLLISALSLVPEDSDPRKGLTVHMLAEFYYERGLFQSARPLFLRDIWLKKPLGDRYPGLVYDLLPLATIETDSGRTDSAEKYLNWAMEIATRHEMISEQAAALRDLTRIQLNKGNTTQADRFCHLLEGMESTPKTASSLISLAETYLANHDYKTAARLYEKASHCKLSLLLRPDEGNFVANAFNNLARIYLWQKSYLLAEAISRKALTLTDSPGIGVEITEADTNAWLAIALIEQNRMAEALPYLRKAIELRKIYKSRTGACRYLKRDCEILELIQHKADVPKILIKSGL